MDNSSDSSFFCDEEVENGCQNPIKYIFQTLLLERNLIQQDVANSLNVDKAYISRVFNGLEIPHLDMRLKISKFFGVDSALIWRTCDLYHIRKILAKQKKRAEMPLNNKKINGDKIGN